ncbi:unnamed protein product, partial [Durusdinium trenchii]
VLCHSSMQEQRDAVPMDINFHPENQNIMTDIGNREAQHYNDFADRTRQLAKSSQMVVHYQDSQGKARIKGGTDLKSSQAYPKRFGTAYARVRSRFLKSKKRSANAFLRRALRGSDRANNTLRVNRLWIKHSNLEPVLDFLMKR